MSKCASRTVYVYKMTSIYCNAAFKTRKRQYLCHIMRDLYVRRNIVSCHDNDIYGIYCPAPLMTPTFLVFEHLTPLPNQLVLSWSQKIKKIYVLCYQSPELSFFPPSTTLLCCRYQIVRKLFQVLSKLCSPNLCPVCYWLLVKFVILKWKLILLMPRRSDKSHKSSRWCRSDLNYVPPLNSERWRAVGEKSAFALKCLEVMCGAS